LAIAGINRNWIIAGPPPAAPTSGPYSPWPRFPLVALLLSHHPLAPSVSGLRPGRPFHLMIPRHRHAPGLPAPNPAVPVSLPVTHQLWSTFRSVSIAVGCSLPRVAQRPNPSTLRSRAFAPATPFRTGRQGKSQRCPRRNRNNLDTLAAVPTATSGSKLCQ
jgi:hypothetical protein